jgi:hypothetical protein
MLSRVPLGSPRPTVWAARRATACRPSCIESSNASGGSIHPPTPEQTKPHRLVQQRVATSCAQAGRVAIGKIDLI